jgi:hypothetical protein
MQFRKILQNGEAQRENLERTQDKSMYFSTRLTHKSTQVTYTLSTVNTSVLVCQNPKQQAPVELINSSNLYVKSDVKQNPGTLSLIKINRESQNLFILTLQVCKSKLLCLHSSHTGLQLWDKGLSHANPTSAQVHNIEPPTSLEVVSAPAVVIADFVIGSNKKGKNNGCLTSAVPNSNKRGRSRVKQLSMSTSMITYWHQCQKAISSEQSTETTSRKRLCNQLRHNDSAMAK